MNISYYKIENNTLAPVEQAVSPKEWSEKLSWVIIYTNDREKVADYLVKNGILECGSEYIISPETHAHPKVIGSNRVINVVHSGNNIYESDYLTIIMAENLLITISSEYSKLLDYHTLEVQSKSEHTAFMYAFFYRLIADILEDGISHAGMARKRIHNAEAKMDNEPEKIEPKEIIRIKREITHLADIIEDQYVLFGILASLSVNKYYLDNVDKVKELIKGFEPLNVTLSRLEEKAESLHSQYIMVQQEKATRKINLLTIVQAIFVPLTFIAGVYGMNFVRMPELQWAYGYYITWGLFVIIGAISVGYFYKNGWFD